MPNQNLDPQLRELVRRTVALLGEVIERNTNRALFQTIESIRLEMTRLRNGTHKSKVARLEKLLQRLSRLSDKEQFYVAHAFSLMLEIMNTCENAYRTHLIRRRPTSVPSGKMEGIYYVLTAHPTEARSPENVAVFSELQYQLVESLSSHYPWYEETLRGLIQRAWHTPITRQRKPQVADEAEYIYSLALKPSILRALLRTPKEVAPVYLRSWVGGDKDGHPGVNAKTMIESWQLSRAQLLKFLEREFQRLETELRVLKKRDWLVNNRRLLRELKSLRQLKNGDGARVNRFRAKVDAHFQSYRDLFGSDAPPMTQIIRLFEMFPGLVVPLELRESSDLIVLAAGTKEPQPISKMLQTLSRISEGASPRRYVRGLIISMCGSIDHIDAGLQLVHRYFGEPRLPVIPLFEQESALRDSPRIVAEMLCHPLIKKGLDQFWKRRFEVMLGYSDSAKEVGALKSRLLISETMRALESLCAKAKVTPVFFHGSGGSVDRGGGSIQEQTAWLSPSSLRLFKATVQGEMVERTFSSKEIFRSGVDSLISQSGHSGSQRNTQLPAASPILHSFADEVSSFYKQAIHSPEFLEVVQKATPYRFLSALKLGSRPSRRGKITNVQNLRAIPWVLCWTQTRVLFPVWWGTGSAWDTLNPKSQNQLRLEYKRNPLLRSYVKVLGFSLAKVELPIWELYLRRTGIPSDKVKKIILQFQREHRLAKQFVYEITGQSELLWYRPWLHESIQLRAPMIHPLNLLQMLIMERRDPGLLRETVAGIAIGMLTTG